MISVSRCNAVSGKDYPSLTQTGTYCLLGNFVLLLISVVTIEFGNYKWKQRQYIYLQCKGSFSIVVNVNNYSLFSRIGTLHMCNASSDLVVFDPRNAALLLVMVSGAIVRVQMYSLSWYVKLSCDESEQMFIDNIKISFILFDVKVLFSNAYFFSKSLLKCVEIVWK